MIPLRSGRRLRRVRTTMKDLVRLSSEVGDDYLRVELDEPPSPGLADKVREILENAVDVAVVHRQRDEEKPDPAPRLGRSPQELFAEYLRERDEDEPRLRALFDELLDEVHAPG
jgi:exonuclease SbcD